MNTQNIKDLRADFPAIRASLNRDYLKGFEDKILYHGRINGALNRWVYDDIYKSTKDIFKHVARSLGLPQTGIKSRINGEMRVYQRTEDSYLVMENCQCLNELEGQIFFRTEDGVRMYSFYIDVTDWRIDIWLAAWSRSFERLIEGECPASKFD